MKIKYDFFLILEKPSKFGQNLLSLYMINQFTPSPSIYTNEFHHCFSQVLEGAVVVVLCRNEAEVKFHVEIDHHISSTDQAGKIRLTELAQQGNVWVEAVQSVSLNCAVTDNHLHS